jgi:hypothetical protein
MRFLKVMTISLFLVCCSEQSRADFFPSEAKKAQSLMYVKDNRTNLCFVHNYVTNSNLGSYDIYTNVPCTPEVEKLLVK